MSDYKVLLGYLSLAIALLGYIIYFRQILLKLIIPHPFSWMIWGIVESIAFTAQVVKDAGPGAWATGFTAVVCFIISGLAFFYSKKRQFSKLDWIFLTMAIVAILLWVITKDPTMSVILVTLTDAIGNAFTLIKAYHEPFKESASVFGLSSARSVVAVGALSTYNISTYLYPASLIFTNLAVVAVLLWKRRMLKRHA